jgi:2-C-methyl-D-erythritol 4-phosphate cytidylyltransferase
MFRYGLLREALEKCRAVTDEAGAIEAPDCKPKLVRGDATNLKVTYPADLALAAMILAGAQMNFRVGQGYDVHRLVEGAS